MNVNYALAFDLEGTLVDLEHFHHTAHLTAARRCGANISDIDWAKENIPNFIGGPDEVVAQQIWDKFSISGEASAFVSDYLSAKRREFDLLTSNHKIEAREGACELIEWSQAKGAQIAIGTLTDKEKAEVILASTGLGKLIDAKNIVFREDVINVKPAPDVWLETARRIGISPYMQIVIDDAPIGIRAGIRAGSITIGMPPKEDPNITRRLFDAGANYVAHSFVGTRLRNLIGSLFTN